VERAQLQRGAVTIDTRTNSGAQHRFHFVEASFD
jgi:hypothetical protein